MCMFITEYNCGTQYSTAQYSLMLQTIITAQMMPTGGEGALII